MVLAELLETSALFSIASRRDRAADEKRNTFNGEPATTVSPSVLPRLHHEESV